MKLTKPGTIVITPDGRVSASGFRFQGDNQSVDLKASALLATEWAIRVLEDSLNELRKS